MVFTGMFCVSDICGREGKMMGKTEDNYHSVSMSTAGVSVVVNIILTVVKLVLGIISGSIAIMADAFHSFSDIVTTSVVMLTFSISRRPADSRHPFGHGRIEDIAGLLMCFVLALVGVEFIKYSIVRFFTPSKLHINNLTVGIIFSTAVVKIILGAFTSMRARLVRSSLLGTDAAHHYSDGLTSFIIGGGLIFVKKGFYAWDTYLGIFVALLIILWAVKMGWGFFDNLLGRRVSEEVYARIKEVALSFPEVKDVHDVEVHSYGHRKIVSLHIVVDKDLSLEKGHSVADSVEKRLLQEGVSECITHVDITKEIPKVKHTHVEKVILNFINAHPLLKDFHKLRIITTESENILNFHLLLDSNISLEESHEISHKLSQLLKSVFKFSQVNIHLEPYRDNSAG